MKELVFRAPERARSFWDRHFLPRIAAAPALLLPFLAISAACNDIVDAAPRGPRAEPTSVVRVDHQLPLKGTWYLTSKVHSDSFSGANIPYAITFTVGEFTPCPGNPAAERQVLATAKGIVILAGDPNNPGSANFNRVKILHKDGQVTGYGRLEGIRVKVGQEVEAGEPLGKPSCLPEPGGEQAKKVGFQFFLGDSNGPKPIVGFEMGGWRVVGDGNWTGLFSLEGQIAANSNKCGPDRASIENGNTCFWQTNVVSAR